MMCRCQDIEKCERDIAILSGVLNRELNRVRDNQDLAMSKYNALSQALSDAVNIHNLERICRRFSVIRQRQSEQTESLQLKRSGELSRLRSRLVNYQNEDRRYHEMIAQRAGR